MVALKTEVLALTEDGLRCLPVDKTVVYTIRDKKGRNLFTAVASRGRVLARIKEHLVGGSSHLIGGITVQIEAPRRKRTGNLDCKESCQFGFVR